MKLRVLILLAAGALVACNAPTVPDFTYYRLPHAQPLAPVSEPLFRSAVVVEPFAADGIYSDQALVYALDADAQQVREYHYQLWTDPLTRVLQRRLILLMRNAGVAKTVTDELPASQPAIRISGLILRFDRVPVAAGGYQAVVAVRMRVEARNGVPLLDEFYRVDKLADGKNLKATVDAYGAALDEIFARFHSDLRKLGEGSHAG